MLAAIRENDAAPIDFDFVIMVSGFTPSVIPDDPAIALRIVDFIARHPRVTGTELAHG